MCTKDPKKVCHTVNQDEEMKSRKSQEGMGFRRIPPLNPLDGHAGKIILELITINPKPLPLSFFGLSYSFSQSAHRRFAYFGQSAPVMFTFWSIGTSVLQISVNRHQCFSSIGQRFSSRFRSIGSSVFRFRRIGYRPKPCKPYKPSKTSKPLGGVWS